MTRPLPFIPTIAALVACAAPAAMAEAPKSGEAPSTIAIIPAMDALQVGDTLALWAPDLRSVLGHDAAGQRRWRLATGDQGGLRELDTLEGNLLVYAGAEAILVAPSDGKVLGRIGEVHLGAPGGPIGCRIRARQGACALACECRFQPISCADLSPLGPPAVLPRFETRGPDGAPSLACPTFSGAVLGRSGDAVITAFPTETDKPFFGVPEVAIARHAATGAELWRSSELGFFDPALSGVTSDGTCYAASRAGRLIVFDCQRATVRWQRSFTVPKGGEPQVEASASGLIVRDGARVHLLDLGSGAPRWSVEVPSDRLVLVASASGTNAARRIAKSVRGARVIDPSSGASVADLSFPDGTDRWPRPFAEGWIVLGEKRVEVFDGRGRSRGGLGSANRYSGLVVGSEERVAVWDARGLTVATIGTSRPARVLDGAGQRVIGLEGALGLGILAVLKDGRGLWDPKDPESFGELRLYRL